MKGVNSSINETADPEAIALAACYRLLLQKYRERQAQATQTADNEPSHTQTTNDNHSTNTSS